MPTAAAVRARNRVAWQRAMDNMAAVVRAAGGGETALEVIAIQLVNTIRVAITRQWPPASAPGEPPHLRTGGLRLSYTWDKGTDEEGPYVRVFSDPSTRQPIKGEEVDYAAYLEFGTSEMAPRPHVRPAVNVVTPQVTALVRGAIAAAQRAEAAKRPRP